MKNAHFLIITGLSGSGKSYVHNCFEDMGYFCVDNLPLGLMAKFFELTAETGGEINRVAVVVDVRDRSFATDFLRHYEQLKQDYNVKLLFLEASDEVLVRRFSETRRPHPLADHQRPLQQAMALERQLVANVRDSADFVIDTSRFNVHELRDYVIKKFSPEQSREALLVSVISFGYKYGIPYDSDLLFDVRFLPNPYFVAELKNRNGLDPDVVTFVRQSPEAGEFLERLSGFMNYLLPRYIDEGKSYLTISIGCTGGKHRSVVVANELAGLLRTARDNITVSHRDLDRT
jgi:UPF0042 nucleotide-binding protein